MVELKIFTIKCRRCGNNMKYSTQSQVKQLSKKIKRCVYCGFSNKVSKCIHI